MSIFKRFGKSEPDRDERSLGMQSKPKRCDDPVELSKVVASILGAVSGARRSLDTATCELAKIYWADPILRSLPLPVFSIPEVTVHLKFAVHRVETSQTDPKTLELHVIVDTTSLSELPASLVSQIELKLTPESVRIFEANSGEILLNRV